MSLGTTRFWKGSCPQTYPLSNASKSTISTFSIVLSTASLHSQLQAEFPGHRDVLIPKDLSVNYLQPASLKPAKEGEKGGIKRAWERGKDVCLDWSWARERSVPFSPCPLHVYPGLGPALGISSETEQIRPDSALRKLTAHWGKWIHHHTPKTSDLGVDITSLTRMIWTPLS